MQKACMHKAFSANQNCHFIVKVSIDKIKVWNQTRKSKANAYVYLQAIPVHNFNVVDYSCNGCLQSISS